MADDGTPDGSISDGLDFDGIGLSLDDLDLDRYDDFSTLPLDRPRYQPKGWWSTTDAEEHFLDLPPFQDAGQRAKSFDCVAIMKNSSLRPVQS